MKPHVAWCQRAFFLDKHVWLLACFHLRRHDNSHTVRFSTNTICQKTFSNTWAQNLVEKHHRLSGNSWFHTGCTLHSPGWKWWVCHTILPRPPHFFILLLTMFHCAAALIVSCGCSRWIYGGDRLKPGAALGTGQNSPMQCPRNENGLIVIEAVPIKAMHAFALFLIVAADCICGCSWMILPWISTCVGVWNKLISCIMPQILLFLSSLHLDLYFTLTTCYAVNCFRSFTNCIDLFVNISLKSRNKDTLMSLQDKREADPLTVRTYHAQNCCCLFWSWE